MKYRFLGKSGFKVSEISFGCMSLEPAKPAQNEELLRTAVDSGINFFDTADLYDKGQNEIMVGEALTPVRKQVFLSTKVGNVWNNDGKSWHWDATPEHIMLAAEDSLRRLQTDYLDLYMLHGGTLDDNIPEVIETFELLKQQGKIRAYGISSIRPNVVREWVAGSNLDAVMMQYSLLDRRPEEAVMNLLNGSGVSLLARGSLAQGILADKPAKAIIDYSGDDVGRLKIELGPPQKAVAYAIEYVLKHPVVASAVVGFRYSDQLTSVLQALKTEISTTALERLVEILEPNFYKQHR